MLSVKVTAVSVSTTGMWYKWNDHHYGRNSLEKVKQ